MEGSEDNSAAHEKKLGTDQRLETHRDHERCVQKFHIFNMNQSEHISPRRAGKISSRRQMDVVSMEYF
jgi:hypothetical protein